MKTKHLPASTGLGVLLLLVTVLNSFGEAPRRFLPNDIPAAVAGLRAIGPCPATNQLHLAIALPLRNQEELNGLLKEIYDPASANYHHYLKPQQFTEKFGPTISDYQAVINFARDNGLKVTGTHPGRTVVDVAGSVADIERTFNLKISVFQHPKEARTFFAPDGKPSIDSSLPVQILSVSGLDNYSLPQPADLKMMPPGQLPGAAPNAGSGPGGAYLGYDFRAAYVPGTPLTGTGQSVALVEFDAYYSNDITAYENLAGLPAVTLNNVNVNGVVITPGSDNNEVALDIEMAICMAPGVSSIVVYEATNGTPWLPLLTQIADENLAAQISCSWFGGPVDLASEQVFQRMAAQGQSFFNASGDADAFTGSIPFPAESTNITQVGGTTLSTTGPLGSRVSETVWNRGGGVGTGGGVSTYYPLPSWQQGVSSALVNGGSSTARNVPDVALTAENILVKYGNGQTGTFGGTSCAAPLWAGFMALVNQQAVAASQPVAGFINPAVYDLANQSVYNSVFNDITTGNNTSTASPNAFYAVPGYDLCTGLGTPNGTNFINALLNPDPLVIVPNSGFVATGTAAGTFDITSQTFFLTNSGASPLDWSLINTSAWLDVSTSGGTLAPGAGDSVVVSLNPVASGLAAGAYPAGVLFSNAASGVAHSRFFLVRASDPLLILPTNKFTFSGLTGGPFMPGTQQIILTNPSTGAFTWSINNTSTWFTVSPTGGSLSPGDQAGVTFTPAPGITNLTDGSYKAFFQVTNLTSQFVQVVTGVVAVGTVQNPGFETGDFTGWTVVGSGDTFNFVANGSDISGISPHSGSYYAALGEFGTLVSLSQTIPTSPGQKYLISLWLNSSANPYDTHSTTPNQFKVSWNGTAVYNKVNVLVVNWIHLQFLVTATGTTSDLLIQARDDPFYLGLDDVAVIPGIVPSIVTQPTNLALLPGSTAVFRATAGGTAPFAYQWRKNGANLFNGGSFSGVTTTNLTITNIATNSAANFSLFVTNAYGSITSSVATLTVVLPPGITGVSANTNGSVTLKLTGSPGISYVLESTTNLPADPGWLPVATNMFDLTGIWYFTDAQATNFLQQFYRLKYSP